jgi:1-deoxy-D-xylulose-5-phosphate synthase
MTQENEYELLNSICSPSDIRGLSIDQLTTLAAEIRKFIIHTVSETGGHLASSLGAIEFTIALHHVFNTPTDKICWDVGHQAYAHKLLTGRQDDFATLRRYGGLSGFPKCSESEYDVFSVGHAGTSISSALGIVEANRLNQSDDRVAAVIGDGSLTSGLAFEGLNQAGQLKRNFVIVLNDNEFSISPNVGAMSSFLSRKLAGSTGRAVRRRLKEFLQGIPGVGQNMFKGVKRTEEVVKAFFTPGFLFEALGFEYVGPLQGHNIERLTETFQNVSVLDNPVLVHVITAKGKGYPPAEANPSKFHGIGPFDVATGEVKPTPPAPPSFTSVFGRTAVELADADEKIVTITAAMPIGTGLDKFAEKYPERFFDVGIAEQHAVTFAAGLAKQGYKPIVAIYSTFLQRSYDQVIHDVALQELPVIMALDRGGLVGDDGPTHHGTFDLSYMRHVPGLIFMAPKDENELRHMLFSAVAYDAPTAIRYPRGSGLGVPMDEELAELPLGKGELLVEGTDITFAAIGNMVPVCVEAASILAKEGISAAVINARFIKPMDEGLILSWAEKTGHLVTVEENVRMGGFGSAVLETLSMAGIHNVKTAVHAIPDQFIQQGSQSQLRSDLGLTPEGVVEVARKLLND